MVKAQEDTVNNNIHPSRNMGNNRDMDRRLGSVVNQGMAVELPFTVKDPHQVVMGSKVCDIGY